MNAALAVAAAMLLTGCQAGTPEFARTLSVTSLPSVTDATPKDAPETDPGQSVGLDLHFGATSFGLNCSTDSLGDSTRGTAAVICSWTNQPR